MNQKSSATLVVCIGVSGSGKTTLALALSRQLAWEFLDADDFHSNSNIEHMASGEPLTDLMRVPWIASITAALNDRAKHQQHCILAFSGLSFHHRQALRETGYRSILFLHLQVATAELERRMRERKRHFMPPNLLESQLIAFQLTEDEADVVTLDGEDTINTLVDTAMKILKVTFQEAFQETLQRLP